MIVRGVRSQSYTVISNAIMEDPNIDWRDLGLLVYLLSKPDHWKVSTTHLASQRKAGIDAVRGSLKALRIAGYVVMQKNGDGTVDWVVFDSPQKLDEPELEKPKQGKTLTGKNPNRENPALVNTDIQTVSTDTNNAREGSLISDDFGLDAEVLARLFSSGVREEVGQFLLAEFVNKNISTGYVSRCWSAEFASYCKRYEWRYKKHEEQQSRSNKGGAAKNAESYNDRLKRRFSGKG